MTQITVPDGSPFPVANLPIGIGDPGDGRRRVWVAVGDSALDLAGLQDDGLLAGVDIPAGAFARADAHTFLACGRSAWRSFRERLRELLDDDGTRLDPHVVDRRALRMAAPVRPRDYVDFYSSLHHATNLGRIFRPDGDALHPNWRHIPIGYHGRSGSIVPDGTAIARPHGHRVVDGAPIVGPSLRLDIELEVGTVVGVGNDLGCPIAIDDAGEHLYGLCLVNDWSARDIQAFEYQPLGPFLGKSFATSVSPWLVSFDALDPFRVAAPPQDPAPAAHLRTDQPWAFDLTLEVWLDSATMRATGRPPMLVSSVGFADMYWSPAQQLTHLTSNGASAAPGDLFASGTVSGPTTGSEGSLIERTWNGERPLELPDGTSRSFLVDGDRVVLRGWAGTDPDTRIGLGSVSGTIIDTIGGS